MKWKFCCVRFGCDWNLILGIISGPELVARGSNTLTADWCIADVGTKGLFWYKIELGVFGVFGMSGICGLGGITSWNYRITEVHPTFF